MKNRASDFDVKVRELCHAYMCYLLVRRYVRIVKYG